MLFHVDVNISLLTEMHLIQDQIIPKSAVSVQLEPK